jgi:hypothetical protein
MNTGSVATTLGSPSGPWDTVMKVSAGTPMARLVPAPTDVDEWYTRQWGCLRGVNPTAIAQRHTFSDAPIPRGVPFDPAAPAKVCLEYRTAWPAARTSEGASEAMVETERHHPQFAFSAGFGPVTVAQVDAESQLRRLDQPLGRCQAVIAADAPLYRNTVAPPVPAAGVVPEYVQNATNPIAAIVRGEGAERCRQSADQVATAMSGRWVNNPTRQDTMRMEQPFAPPGIGRGEARPPVRGRNYPAYA